MTGPPVQMTDQPLPPSTRVIYALFDACGRHRGGVLWGIAAILVAGFLATGIHIIKKEEMGVCTRFGKVVHPQVGPGIHYHIPVIEKVYIHKVKRIIRYQVASKASDTVNFTILSGDINLLEVDVALQYKIDSLQNYLFVTSDPLAMVTVYTRESLVDILGQNFIDLILTSNRNIIQARLFDLVTERLEGRDIGLELVSLDIVDIRPIDETIPAFRDVSDAFAERVQAISDANRKRERLVAHSRGQAEAIVVNARAKARERIVQAESSAGAFLALLEEYRKQPSHVGITRYWQRMREIFAEASLAAVNPGHLSAIDINMIDGGAGFTPADMALAGAARRGRGPRQAAAVVGDHAGRAHHRDGPGRQAPVRRPVPQAGGRTRSHEHRQPEVAHLRHAVHLQPSPRHAQRRQQPERGEAHGGGDGRRGRGQGQGQGVGGWCEPFAGAGGRRSCGFPLSSWRPFRTRGRRRSSSSGRAPASRVPTSAWG